MTWAERVKNRLDENHYLLEGHSFNNDHYTGIPDVKLEDCTDRACPDPCHPRHKSIICYNRTCKLNEHYELKPNGVTPSWWT